MTTRSYDDIQSDIEACAKAVELEVIMLRHAEVGHDWGMVSSYRSVLDAGMRRLDELSIELAEALR